MKILNSRSKKLRNLFPAKSLMIALVVSVSPATSFAKIPHFKKTFNHSKEFVRKKSNKNTTLLFGTNQPFEIVKPKFVAALGEGWVAIKNPNKAINDAIKDEKMRKGVEAMKKSIVGEVYMVNPKHPGYTISLQYMNKKVFEGTGSFTVNIVYKAPAKPAAK